MSTELRARLEREFKDVSESDFTEFPGVSVVTPASEDELCETLRFAASEKLRVLPVGRGSKLGWAPVSDRVDFLVSTRSLSGVVAYEPGDGTLTALAGSTMSDLEREVHGGGHHLTPDVPFPDRSTLGGVLAAGQSGRDRHKYGPARHHVLGMRVALADGRIARSGGRLVKNVTGYDMQRLYCGSFGSLCVIVEASLRLFPAPRVLVVIRNRTESIASALENARAVRQLPIDARALTVEDHGANGATLHVTLAGREDQVEWETERVRTLLPPAELLEGEAALEEDGRVRDLERPSAGWAQLVAGCVPSRLERVASSIDEATRSTRLLIQPALAEVSAFTNDSGEDEPEKIASAVRAAGGQVRWRRRTGAREIRAAGHDIARRLRTALDPDGVFASRLD